MANFGTVLVNEIIKHLLRSGTWTKPTNLYLAFYTSATDADDGGTEVSTTNTNYARTAINPSDSNWAAPSARHTENSVAVTFPVPKVDAPAANWGLISHWGLHTAQTGTGNRVLHGQMNTAKNVNAGDPAPTVAIGDCDITFL